MAKIRLILVWGSIAAGCVLVLVTDAQAGLSGPPTSHVEPMPDGRHMLVFLSYVPLAEDEGRMAILPDGAEVDLRSTFPASGCYEIETHTPLWTAPWDGKDYWSVSDDCRFLVRCNIFGDGTYCLREGGRLSWGLKLYDGGLEIKSFDVAELVDYPSLMPFTSSDWHYEWLDWDCIDRLLHGNEVLIRTSTHEQYRIDLCTGAILEEFRMWRMLARVGSGLAALACVGLVAIVVRLPKRTAFWAGAAAADLLAPADVLPSSGRRRRFLSFSLRTLLIITTMVAFLCGFGFRWPHVMLLVGSLMVAALLTRRTARLRRASRFTRARRSTVALGLYVVVTFIVWVVCYILSFPAVLGLLDWLRAPDDVRMAVILTIYRPIYWISYYGGSELLRPLTWYARAW